MAGIAENETEINADVAIVGSGIAGGTLACLLGGMGLRVALIDREADSARLDAAFDGRTTAISYGSRNVVEAAGLWQKLASDASPIRHIRIADGDSPLCLDFDHQDVEGRPFGWIVENRLIRRALAERIAALETITLLAPAAVTGFTAERGRALLRLQDGRGIAATLAVGADGKHSTLRDLAGIAVNSQEYGQTALVFIVAHEHPHDQVAVEHFHPAGPFAVLPMTGDGEGRHRSSVVWTLSPETAAAMLAMEDGAFDAAIATVFAEYWGEVHVAGRRFAYPLRLTHAARYAGERLALVADAAHAIHPIAGQGLNLGLRDIALLTELVRDAARLGLDIGSRTLLEHYAVRRRGDNQRMVVATDALNRLFSNDIAPVRLARAAGLGMVQHIPPLKRFFMLTAMGIAGQPPRLIRGEALDRKSPALCQ
jgi:2-octaprenyl-6-methoxyphenol hydroxylase